ncbi:MAG: hypothetical protein KDF59_16600 [Nitrosomonas sp.]|nr:hypothetical protein [Nitrosomonas sp.]
MNDKKTILERASEFFPHVETHVDVSGTNRKFVLNLREVGSDGGYVVRAIELEVKNGYEFEAYSETNPFNALAIVRSKIRRGLAIKYLSLENECNALRFDEFQGRIGYGGVIIDGQFIPFTELCEILQVYEGFSINVSITDPTS